MCPGTFKYSLSMCFKHGVVARGLRGLKQPLGSGCGPHEMLKFEFFGATPGYIHGVVCILHAGSCIPVCQYKINVLCSRSGVGV